MRRSKPVLYAALLCERVFQDEDGVSTLFRVVDVFNYRMGLRAPASQIEVPEIEVEMACVLFTKWGGTADQYSEGVTLINPRNEERDIESEFAFVLKGGPHFQQIRHNMRLRLKEPGMYAFRVYLDHQPVVDVPHRVNIDIGLR